MGLFDKLRGEFIDIVEWTDDTSDTIVWRFERHGNEIKMGAQLTVRPSQVAVFINEGQLADVFQPGMHTLETKNLPILSTLQGWKYGFSSPFKAEVYFVSTRWFTDLKWGTMNPVMLRDAEFGPVRLRAFGTYTVRVKDAAQLLREVVGTDNRFTTDEITEQLRNLIVTRFATVLAEAKIPVLDLAASYEQLGQFITARVKPEVEAYGLEIGTMLVENVSLPQEVEAALDRRSSMGIVGDLSRYAQFQAAEAMTKAAENPGSGAGAGIGLMVGVGMAGQVASAAQPQPQPQPAAVPPPLPQAGPQFFMAAEGKQEGPFGLDALKTQVGSGRLARATLVWSQGMAAWAPAGEVEALKALFAAVPPPLPPG